jgi:hypothetical protein
LDLFNMLFDEVKSERESFTLSNGDTIWHIIVKNTAQNNFKKIIKTTKYEDTENKNGNTPLFEALKIDTKFFVMALPKYGASSSDLPLSTQKNNEEACLRLE